MSRRQGLGFCCAAIATALISAATVDLLRISPAEATPYVQDTIKQYALAQGVAPTGVANCSSASASCSVASFISSGSIIGTGTTNFCFDSACAWNIKKSGSNINITTSGNNPMVISGTSGSLLNPYYFESTAGGSYGFVSSGAPSVAFKSTGLTSGNYLVAGLSGANNYGIWMNSNGNALNWDVGNTTAFTTTPSLFTVNVAAVASSSKNKGTITLSGGTGTATVTAGTVCDCSLNTSAGTAAPKCSVSSTTLTVTGSGTDVINYLCF